MQKTFESFGSSAAEEAENGRFRPALGKRVSRERSTGAGFRNAVLARSSKVLGPRGSGVAGRARVAVRAPGAGARRVVVKARVIPMRGSGKKAAVLHVRYIERDGVERDGSPGRMYGAEGPIESARFEEPLKGEQHQFRLIVSPEDAGELELTDYVRRLMAQVEADAGRELEWGAVNHYDTDNPHAHVILRGVDREGHSFRLDREYIAHGLRRRAQEIATEELGPRPAVAIAEQRVREVEQDRLTTLDREIGQVAVDGHVDAVSLRRGRAERSRELLVARLGHLKDIGLATRESKTGWVLVPGWQERLRGLGERNDIIKQMHRALRADPGRYYVVRRGQPLPRVPTEPERVYGRVVAKVLADELKGTLSAVVETPSGAGYHVPLDSRSAELLHEGDLVRITARTPASVEAGAETPKVRLFVDRERPLHEQVHHRGLVWLDELPAGFIALHGFGAEVLRAAAARREVVRGFGIDPMDRDRRAKLAELERRAVGEQAKGRRRGRERGS